MGMARQEHDGSVHGTPNGRKQAVASSPEPSILQGRSSELTRSRPDAGS